MRLKLENNRRIYFTQILLSFEVDLTPFFYTLGMVKKIKEIAQLVILVLRRIINEESESLDKFYAQYE